MIADQNPIFKIEGFSYRYAKELVHEIWSLANSLGYKEFVWQLSNPIYDDITYLKGVGPKRAKQLKAYGINKIYDVLEHLPRKYLDRRNIKPINQIKIGEEAVVIGKVVTKNIKKIGKRRLFQIIIEDGTGQLQCVWFNALSWITEKFNIKLFRFGKEGYINTNQTEINRDLINQYKVFVAKASPGGDSYPHQVISEPLIGGPNTCCTETYILIGPLKSKLICENLISYMKTKFFRFLMILIKNTQDVPKRVYSFVPILDFNKRWTDQKLFKKYNITPKEIDFINSLIKPMND